MTSQIQDMAGRYLPETEQTPAAQLLLDNLDLWSSATRTKTSTGRGRSSSANSKIELTGIKQLRDLILELAVRGKLVPQNPEDEPASELLKRIEAEKAQLLADGTIKKPKKLTPIEGEEKPFELPQGWKWAKLGEITTQITDGVHHTPNYIESGVPFISVKDIDGRKISFADCRYISEEQHLDINARCNPEYGDLLICRIGTLGRVTPVLTDQKFSLFVSVGLLKLPKSENLMHFLHKLLNSPLLEQQYQEVKAGGSHTNKLNLGSLPQLLIPLPPLAEQHRIEAKVNQLMALCDQLEQHGEQQLSAHQQLVETLLATLTNAQDAAELTAHWQRLAEHFDLLFSGPLGEWAIDRLKETILQLAVMGKLVPQDPNDEPASELLKRIEAEKAQLLADGKIKKPKKLKPIEDEEKPFERPVGWLFVHLADVTDIQSGIAKGKKNAGKITVELPYLRVANVQRGTLHLDEIKTIEVLESDIQKYSVLPRDLLITEGGDWDKVGRTAIWEKSNGVMLHQNHVFKARLILNEQSEIWLEKYLNSKLAREYFSGSSKQTTNLASINKTQLSHCVVPIPPLNEQHRIVQKVDQLFALCDQLKVRLNAATETRLNLSEAMVEQALVSSD